MRSFLTLTVLAVTAIPGVTWAQPPDPPRIELGAQVSTQTGETSAATWSPRITLNLTPLTAIEGSVDVRPRDTNFFGTHTSEQAYTLHWRQTLFTAGRWQVSGVLGAGGSRREHRIPEQIFEGRDGPQVIPAHTFVESTFAVQLGPAVQFEAAPWLALRGDVRLTMSGHGGLRGMVGAVVPIGRFRAGDRPGLGSPTPPLADWQGVKPGREVWVATSSGALVHGEVSAISGRTLSIRQRNGEVPVPLDDIRLVEGRDSLKNGILIGAASGALATGSLFTWVASLVCESDPCDPIAGVAFALGAASGAVGGGLLGAMVDGLIPGRQTLFERTAIRVIPSLSPKTKALSITVDWP